ncbi:MAG: ISNCY family transposase [Pseudonocardia sp.]|nr:ISNCY family transposase [Pseudonocardia sp.]
MLRLRDGQATLWEQMLPEEIRLVGPELEAVDRLLDDPRFLAPFVERFGCRIGRPTIPIESYLRLMYLKHRHGLGYETLVREVADSLSWRHFCRIGLHKAPPHPTTLMKLTRRFGPEIVEDLNQALLERAAADKLIRGRRLRVDTTCIEADVRYPTDSGLCAHAISRLGRAVRTVKGAGLAARTVFRDRRRSAGKAVRRVSGALARGGNTRPAVDRETGVLHELATGALTQARRVLTNASRTLRQAGRAGKAQVARLAREITGAERVIAQTARRLAGERTIPDRVVSLSDPDARPIRRGKPRKPTEFGYKASVADTPEGFVVSHQVYAGNPADAQTLEAAIAGAQKVGMRVTTVLADRGYGDVIGDEALARRGITDSVIPRKGKPAAIQQTRSWRRRYRYRAGAEGRISGLKRGRGWARSRLKGYPGAKIWAGHGVFTHNLDRMVALG